MSSTEDDRKLIQIVEYHQILWDNRIKGFRDRKLTQHAWASVAELLERDVVDVMRRWASLRKQYSRKVAQLRQKTGMDSPEKPWHLLSLLSFLRPCITPRKLPTNPHPSNYTSTEELSSSTSDASSEVSPLLIHVNPVDEARAESCEIPEKKLRISRMFTTNLTRSSTIKKPFRSVAIKSKESRIPPVQSLPSATKNTSTPSATRTQLKEQSDDSVRSTVSKLKSLESSVPKSSTSVSKSKSIDDKSVLKSSETKIENFPTAKDNSFSVSKCTTNNLEVSRSSVGYDADEYFLLSLVPDLKRLTSRQKYQVKSKMLDIVSEQYINS